MGDTASRLLIPLAIFAALSGGVAGFFVAKRYLEKQIDEKYRLEYDEFKLEYAHLYGRPFDVDPDMEEDAEPVERHPEEVEGVERIDISSFKAAQSLTNYNKMFVDDEGHIKKVKTKTVEKVVQAEEDGTYVVEQVEEKVEVSDRPFVIAPDDFILGGEEHEKITIYYYPETDEIRDDQGEEIVNTGRIIGEGVTDHFARDAAGQDVVYVRNDWLEADYEILRMLGTPGGRYD
jgi:uncharacterized protein YneF (UPF0154 family)